MSAEEVRISFLLPQEPPMGVMRWIFVQPRMRLPLSSLLEGHEAILDSNPARCYV